MVHEHTIGRRAAPPRAIRERLAESRAVLAAEALPRSFGASISSGVGDGGCDDGLRLMAREELNLLLGSGGHIHRCVPLAAVHTKSARADTDSAPSRI